MNIKNVLVLLFMYLFREPCSTLSTSGVMELGPLAEKDATRGETHFPTVVFGSLSFAIECLHSVVEKLVCVIYVNI